MDSDIADISYARSKNHNSAIRPPYRKKVEEKLREEITDGNYEVVKKLPRIISPIAAIPKSDGDVRIIHDLSQPPGNSLNDHAKKVPCKYQCFNDALSFLQPNFFCCKVDLKSAYRSVHIKEAQRILTGLEWHFKDNEDSVFLQDKALPFGCSRAPFIFNKITLAVKRFMERRGFPNICVFLDDFLMAESSFSRCILALNTLMALLRSLGFRINYKKLIDPCQKIVFLGIQINTVKGELRLDPDKANKLCDLLKLTATRKRISKSQLQTLAGKLNWACNVIPWGRAHMGSTYQFIRMLKEKTHKLKLTPAFISEINWWLSCLQNNCNTRLIWDPPQASVHISSDSSNAAGGAFCQSSGDWIYTNWILDNPNISTQHINIKELAMIQQAIQRWAPQYPQHHLIIETDNKASYYWLNKGYARHPVAEKLLMSIADIALLYKVTITCLFIPGINNDMADAISRLHARGQVYRFMSLLSNYNLGYLLPHALHLPFHMSLLSAAFLLPQFLRWRAVSMSWTMRSVPSEPILWQNLPRNATPRTSEHMWISAPNSACQPSRPPVRTCAAT